MQTKKGQIDQVYFLIVLLALSISFVMTYVIFSDISDEMAPMLTDSPEAVTVIEETKGSLVLLDSAFLGIMMVFMIVAIALASMLPTHPIFFTIYILITVFGLLVATIGSNVYEAVILESFIVPYASNLPIMTLIMARLPLIFIILGITMMVVTYAKGRGQAGGGELY